MGEGVKAGVGLALSFIGDALAGLAGVGSFLLNAISGAISVTAKSQELHLHAKFAFFGVKFSVKVDIDFAEIDDFIEALMHKIIEVVYQKIASSASSWTSEPPSRLVASASPVAPASQ